MSDTPPLPVIEAALASLPDPSPESLIAASTDRTPIVAEGIASVAAMPETPETDWWESPLRRKLAIRVLMQAKADAEKGPWEVKQEARDFLLGRGDGREMLEFWCEVGGWAPGLVRKWALGKGYDQQEAPAPPPVRLGWLEMPRRRFFGRSG